MNITLATIQTLQEKTKNLDDQSLEHSAGAWRSKERSCLLAVIIHIAEIARRKIHLDRGYAHLGSYCQASLGLSEGEAWSRVQVAVVSNTHPELLVALAQGDLSLTVAGMIARYLTYENKDTLLTRCRGRSKREVEEVLAAYTGAAPKPRSSLRPTFVEVPRESTASLLQAGWEIAAASSKKSEEAAVGDDGRIFSLQGDPSLPEVSSEFQLMHVLRCTISEETKAKLLRLAEVLGIVNPLAHLEDLIAKATEIALHTKDPAHRRTHRQATNKPKAPTASPEKPQRDEKVQKAEEAQKAHHPTSRSRLVPSAIKRELFLRAGYQCEYKSACGKRCAQKTRLEIDHHYPFAWGGSHELQNLVLLCWNHHRCKTEVQQGPWISKASG